MSNNDFKRKFPPDPTKPKKVIAVTSGTKSTRNRHNEYPKYNEKDSSKEIIKKLGFWIGLVVSLIGLYEFGEKKGNEAAKKEFPEVLAQTEAAVKRAEEQNIELKSENKVLTGKLEMTEQSLEKANKAIETNNKIELPSKEEANQVVAQPLSTKINHSETSLFFNLINVSVVNIKYNNDLILSVTLTISGKNEEKKTFSDLVVGDKVTYSFYGKKYEIMITSLSRIDADVMVQQN